MANQSRKALTVKSVRTLADGKHSDLSCRGLYLRVRGDCRTWLFRRMVNGNAIESNLGSLVDVGLSEARTKADAVRAMVAQGISPKALKPAPTAPVISFESDALAYHARKLPSWDALHAVKWLKSLELHAFPKIGAKDTGSLAVDDIVSVIKPIWTTNNVTARNVMGRVLAVQKWASGVRNFDTISPDSVLARLDDIKKPDAKHHAAICWQSAPALYKALASGTIAQKSLAFLLLVGGPREAEIAGAKWAEIGDTWHCPGERLKSGNKDGLNRPLSQAALDLLASLPRNGEMVFGKLTGPAMLKALKDTQSDCTVHGLRSVFRSWVTATAQTIRDHDAAEINLDHKIGNRVHRAYDREDMLPERATLLNRWAEFLGA